MTMRTRLRRYLVLALAVLLMLVTIGVGVGYGLMRASVPKLDGTSALPGLAAPVSLSRDANGTVGIHATTWRDGARALGFVHAQERFFEMDLTRRSAAGELSELFGADTLAMDREKRPHRFRARMAAQWHRLPAEDKAILTTYTEGVNAGLRAMGIRPWQYFLTGNEPAPWREEDCLLMVAEMYYVLQSRNFEDAFTEALLREHAGDAVFNWLKPRGGKWDAALDDSVWTAAVMPGASELNTRTAAPAAAKKIAESTPIHDRPGPLRTVVARDHRAVDEFKPGSNNWAIAAARSVHGGAILADDMHLALGVPNIWFRTELHLTADPTGIKRVAGVTLPGVPGFVVGSNGHLAWGFTSAEGDWFDWVPMQSGAQAGTYLDTDVSRPYEIIEERILVKGAVAETIKIRHSRWGPVLRSHGGRDYALNWLAHRPDAINARLEDMMFATSLDEGLRVLQTSGVPQQNVVIADSAGAIAWTIAGRLPSRTVTHADAPRKAFATPAQLAGDWLPASMYPMIRNPASGALWTANSRQLGGNEGERIGEGRGDLGARAQQIRDRLRETPKWDEASFYALQLDEEARYMRHWAALAKTVSEQRAQPAVQATQQKMPPAKFAEAARLLGGWNGRAAADQPAYAIARTFRIRVMTALRDAWYRAAAPKLDLNIRWDGRMEYPAWEAITQRPLHLLPMPFTDWDTFLAQQLSESIELVQRECGPLPSATWGCLNSAKIEHPLSLAAPVLLRWLNMPATPVGGDNHLPRVQTRNEGASQRLVVSPGREHLGLLTMPGGQSGHPLSPFYGAGHLDWVNGVPTPLLAGEARHRLHLTPAR